MGAARRPRFAARFRALAVKEFRQILRDRRLVISLTVAPVLALGCLFFMIGSRHLRDDQERARKASGGGTRPIGGAPPLGDRGTASSA